jgi:hypothetical protein
MEGSSSEVRKKRRKRLILLLFLSFSSLFFCSNYPQAFKQCSLPYEPDYPIKLRIRDIFLVERQCVRIIRAPDGIERPPVTLNELGATDLTHLLSNPPQNPPRPTKFRAEVIRQHPPVTKVVIGENGKRTELVRERRGEKERKKRKKECGRGNNPFLSFVGNRFCRKCCSR